MRQYWALHLIFAELMFLLKMFKTRESIWNLRIEGTSLKGTWIKGTRLKGQDLKGWFRDKI